MWYTKKVIGVIGKINLFFLFGLVMYTVNDHYNEIPLVVWITSYIFLLVGLIILCVPSSTKFGKAPDKVPVVWSLILKLSPSSV